MTDRAQLQRAVTKASIISTLFFLVAAAMPFVVPQKYETAYLVVMAACIAVGTWWTVKLQRLRKELQTTA